MLELERFEDDFLEDDFFVVDFLDFVLDFFVADLRLEDFFVPVDLRPDDLLDFFEEDFEDFFEGTLPPSLRASESPIAIACFLLVTFLPEPLLSVPRFRSCIAFSTLSDDFFPYLLAMKNPPAQKVVQGRRRIACAIYGRMMTDDGARVAMPRRATRSDSGWVPGRSGASVRNVSS